jgi:outer membrane protein W
MEEHMKHRRAWLSGALAVFVLCSVAPRPASAEWFLDLYGGATFAEDADVEFRGGATLDDTIEFDTTGTGGGRIGYWFLPFLGVALDASYFAPKAENVGFDTRIEVIPISALVLLRAPLFASPAFQNGQLQPYIGGGPSVFVADVKVGEERSDAQAEFGADLRAGITLLFTANFGIFAEARYTYFETNPGGLNTELEVEAFHALGGLTFRW